MRACLFVLAVTVIVAPACGVPGPTGASDQGSSAAGSDSPRPVAGGLSFRTIGTGNGFTCALTPAGEAWCWGFNERGELGAGDAITVTRDSSPHKSRPTRVIAGALGSATTQQCVHWFNGNWPCSSTPVRAAAPPLVAIAAGASLTCGIDGDGRAWCWGGNGEGQLGDGTTTTRERPASVSGAVRFVAVASGNLRQACGVTTGGDVWCWGSGLGFGTDTNKRPSLVPAPAAEGGMFASVTTTWNHTCALDLSGGAWWQS